MTKAKKQWDLNIFAMSPVGAILRVDHNGRGPQRQTKFCKASSEEGLKSTGLAIYLLE